MFFSYNTIFTYQTYFMHKKHTSYLHLISKIISNFFNPIVSLFIFFIVMGAKYYDFNKAMSLYVPMIVMVVLPIIIWLIWNVKTGRYTNMDVSNREQRKSLYIFIAICIIIYEIYYYLQHHSIDWVMLFILILLFALQFSNLYIKSSMHTAFNIFVAALFYEIDFRLGLLWLAIAITVGITRVILKRHTVKEVFFGAGIAFLVSFIYLYCHI